jgi:hypothetical protein
MKRRSNGQPSESLVNLRRQHTRDRRAALFICWSAALGLIAGVPGAIGQAPGPTPSQAPTQRTVGIYLTAISNVDTRRDSLIADFYIWTTSPANAPDPLATVSIVRARTKTSFMNGKKSSANGCGLCGNTVGRYSTTGISKIFHLTTTF